MANLGYVSTFNINGSELSLKDAALTEIVEEIIEAIGANNGDISERINNLHDRAFDALIKISSQNDSEISNIQDGMYKIQYVTVTGEGDNVTETLNDSAILIQKGTNQYLYKDGQISSRTKDNNTWGNWVTFEGGVTSVNGMTGAVTVKANVQSDWNATTGDAVILNKPKIISNETWVNNIMFGGETTISGNDSTGLILTADDEIRLFAYKAYYNSKEIAVKDDIKVTSINGMTGAVTISETQLSKGTATGGGNAVTDINVSNHQITLVKGATYATQSDIDTSIANLVDSAPETLNTLNELAEALGNDENFATTVATQIGEKYTKPSTGIPASDLANGVIPDVPVQSVNGMTGAVTLSLGQTNVIETVKVNGAALTPDANKAVNITSIPANIVTEDSTHKFSTNTEKTKWNNLSSIIHVADNPCLTAPSTEDIIEIVGSTSPGYGYEIATMYFKKQIGASSWDILKINADGIYKGSTVNYNIPTWESIIPAKTSDLTNDSGFITTETKTNWTETNTSSAAYIQNKPDISTNNGFTYIGSETQVFIGFSTGSKQVVLSPNSYAGSSISPGTKIATLNDIPTIPPIPSKTSDLTNDSGFLTQAPVTSVNGQTGAVTVKANVQSDWNATTGDAVILNKPTIPAEVTESTVAGWGFTKNTGTLTTETQLSKGTATGTGNAVTDINVSNHQITLVKGATYATQSDIDTSIANLVDSAPETLDTLNELATALGNDPNFATTVATQIGEKYTKPSTGIPASDLAAGVIPTVPVQSVNGQTGAVNINVGVTSFNGSTGAVTYTAPVTSVNGATGAVNLTIPTVNDSTVTITMNGNTVGTFTLNKSGNTTIDLGTVLTSHQSIKTINNQTITGSGNVSLNTLPTVSASDNGKVLMVVNGAWQLVSPVTLYSGSGTPANAQGNNGDLYVQS